MKEDVGGLDEDDMVRLDRQIRLWGTAAQISINKAHVLLVGMNAISIEIAKNIVLAGVGRLSLVDGGVVDAAFAQGNFLVSEADIGREKHACMADKLTRYNRKLQFGQMVTRVSDLSAELYGELQAVIVADGSVEDRETLSALCHQHSIAMYDIHAFDKVGICNILLADHSYVEKTAGRKGEDGEVVTESISGHITLPLPILCGYYATMDESLALPEVYAALAQLDQVPQPLLAKASLCPNLQRYAAQRGRIFYPLAAIFGGIIGQEIIKIVTHQDKPLFTTLIFDASSGDTLVYDVQPKNASQASIPIVFEDLDESF